MARFNQEDVNRLVSEVREGNDRSFRKLYDIFHAPVVHYLENRFLRQNKAAAEDIFQETALTVYQEIQNFRGESEFSSWFLGIARNKAFAYLRKQKALLSNEVPLTLEPDDISDAITNAVSPASDPAIIVENRELLEKLESKYGLSTGFKEAAMLGLGHSMQEIADLQKVSEVTVRTRTFNFRKRIPDHYQLDQ